MTIAAEMSHSVTEFDATAYCERVSERILIRMMRARLNKGQLAQHLGMTKQTMTERFAARHPWRLDELARVAILLDCDPGDLLPRMDSNHQPLDNSYGAAA